MPELGATTSRPSGSGPIIAFTQIAQMMLPGDAPVRNP
jgi:hypothetical protein